MNGTTRSIEQLALRNHKHVLVCPKQCSKYFGYSELKNYFETIYFSNIRFISSFKESTLSKGWGIEHKLKHKIVYVLMNKLPFKSSDFSCKRSVP